MFVSRKKYNQLCMLISELTLNYMKQREEYAELKKELAELKDQLKPIQDFMNEHAENVLESEREFLKQQRTITEGIKNIVNYDPFAKKER